MFKLYRYKQITIFIFNIYKLSLYELLVSHLGFISQFQFFLLKSTIIQRCFFSKKSNADYFALKTRISIFCSGSRNCQLRYNLCLLPLRQPPSVQHILCRTALCPILHVFWLPWTNVSTAISSTTVSKDIPPSLLDMSQTEVHKNKYL